ncbi:MAG: cytochrome c [Deltaproteobacteria bacterium]|nr:cytochrome c [Deltaproteobacteria bacterium]
MVRAPKILLSVLAPLAFVIVGCEVATPLAPAEPIGTFPTWGEDFNTPKEQPASALGMPTAPTDGTASSTGAAMPGELKSFDGGDVNLGKGIYTTLCARCHGAGGEGGALPGGIAVPAFNDAKWHANMTDKQMARSIALGKGAMPSFMNDLDRDKLAAVIAFVRTLKPKEEGGW